MTQNEQLSIRPVFTPAWRKRVLIGAAIGLVLICGFVLPVGKSDPSWGEYWRVKPLLLTPFLGGVTGLCYDLTEPLRRLKGWAGALFFALSILGYAIGIWMSLVLGMAGTLWN